ncbi:hypothetical protein BJ322DRAFT_1016313 [Thelephora terrestris]|uniref:Uncharacterized protein n=1 Tax=Thelephora terrestris TaxID=56493 RepID=A0A9P6LCS2_9AGAM|nr:hypothetical protein BJ322DRAFT_1016313 [Thelephora terrestris]
MFFASLLFLLVTLFLLLWAKLHRICVLEVSDRSAAHLLMDDSDIRLANVVLAIFRGHIRFRLCKELDPDISMDREEYRSANTFHPPGSLTQDWAAMTHAALCSTKQIIKHSKDYSSIDGEINLRLFIQSVILSTFLHLFFDLPATPTNIEDVVWIVSETRQAKNQGQQACISSPELSRLAKSSPNPRGVFALLSVMQSLVLAAVCTLEPKGEKIPFLRQAGILLLDPISPERGVAQLVEKVKRSNPPVQFIRGRLPLPLSISCNMDFFIPTDLLPPSPCIPGPDGRCASWLHKAALPDRPACGEEWLIHATTIILSAIETQIRQAHLTVDGDRQGPEAWEDWVLRRSRV